MTKKMKHNTQPQRLRADTMTPAVGMDIVVDKCSELPNTSKRLQTMVAAINVARNQIDDPKLKLLLTNVLRAGGVTVE